MTKESSRFSDGELTQLRKDFEQHKAEQDAQWTQLLIMVERNTSVTERLAEAIEEQATSTAGVVSLYADIQGAVRIGLSVQKFLTWLIALGSLGAGIAAGVTYILTKLKIIE